MQPQLPITVEDGFLAAQAEALLPERITLHARWRARHPAVTAASGTLTWEQVERRTNQVAHAIAALGAERGDRVGLVMRNDLAMYEAIFGALKAGCVAVPLNPGNTHESLDGMLRDAEAAVVIASSEHAPRLKQRANVHHLVAELGGASPPPGWIDHAALVERQDPFPARVPIVPNDLCNIIYSSGTTGEPKGIVHDHRNRLRWAYELSLALRARPNMRALVSTGLYSNITWAAMLPALLQGAELIIQPRFDPVEALALMRAHRITHLAYVPVQYQRLLDAAQPAAGAFDALEMAMSVGSRLTPELKARLNAALPCGVSDFYGLTEGFLTCMPVAEARRDPASVGRPLPGCDLLIVDEHDQPVAPDQVGEVLGHSPFFMNGYWRKPEATRKTFHTDDSGRRWLRTGDIGRVDAEGYLTIVDRKKDLIISGGANIYPADIEAVLASHPGVLECAVVGVPSDAWGETPLAVVVRHEGAQVDAEYLRRWANERLGKQQRISYLEFREALPRNANGKILKRAIAEQWLAALKFASTVLSPSGSHREPS